MASRINLHYLPWHLIFDEFELIQSIVQFTVTFINSSLGIMDFNL